MTAKVISNADKTVTIYTGDSLETLKTLPDKSVNTCVTSPPYYNLRDYGVKGQIGLEKTSEDYIKALVEVFSEVKRVLRDDGTLWLNLGDSYINKERCMIPARVALALRNAGWILRDEIIWHKPRTTPAPVKDRTVAAHEMIYLFAKQPKYYFDYLAIEEPSKYPGLTRNKGKAFRLHGAAKAEFLADADKEHSYTSVGGNGPTITVRDTRRKRSVWSVSPAPYKEAHFATFPPDLIEPCILAGSPPGGIVLDPFFGSGTTAEVAVKHGRECVGIELNPDYVEIAKKRLKY